MIIIISKKTDILIPFNKIGENGWAENAERIARSLLNAWGTDFNGCVFLSKTDAELEELEKNIETKLPTGLRLFYNTFGVAEMDDYLQELDMVGRLTEIWNIAAKPYSGPDFSEDELTLFPHLVTFSNHHARQGMFCFHDETNEIYYFKHTSKPHIIKVFDSADDYFKAVLIFIQRDMFDLSIGQSKVEKWVEETLEDVFGKQIREVIDIIND